ncbi:YeiH family protein [Halococcus sp. IIIV-5B]|uniref:YeiH family protein n=1 Tax=Halococcus sp. IIIV-5B TaxID=2321230 RepID=UPI001F4448AA|nr:putative sulfate exporter family transporter [Halococcus sp. IIIV-5B]
MSEFIDSAREFAPGVLLLVIIAGVAQGISAVAPQLNVLLVAIALSVVIANVYGLPDWAASGVGLGTLLLETGIVLLGVNLSIGQVIDAGPVVFALALATVVLGVLFTELLARHVFGVESGTSSLVAAGSSVCGVSAVVATAESIEVTDEQIAYAASTVLLFDALTLVTFPIAGHILQLPAKQFGIWAGLSMFSTGPVTAVGFSYSPAAGQWATITKLVRNAFIGLVAVGYAIYYARNSETTSQHDSNHFRYIWSQFPKFIIGFVLVIVIANIGILSGAQVDLIGRSSDILFLLAFAGIGFDIRLEDLRSTGATPILVVLVHLLAVSTVALGAVMFLF